MILFPACAWQAGKAAGMHVLTIRAALFPVLPARATGLLFMSGALLAATAVLIALARARAGGHRRRMLSMMVRVRLRMYPGPGFTRGRWALWRQHGLPAARRSAASTRPSLTRRDRRSGPWQEYASFAGWAHGWIAPVRVYSGFEQLALVIAPPQKGKSAAAAGKIIDDPGPVVATSIRGDLIASTAGLRQRHGRVDVFNPEGAGRFGSTFGWDLVAGCQAMAAAVRRAGYMVEAITSRGLEDSTFWSDQASMVLASLLHAAALAAARMPEVYRWVLGHNPGQPLHILLQHPAAAPAAAEQMRHYLDLPERTRAGITTTLLAVLRFMQVPEVAATLCPLPGKGFDIEAFLFSRDTLYLVASDAAQSPVPPVFAALLAEITYQARTLGAARRPGSPSRPLSRLDPPLSLELDEAPNIARVPIAAWATWAAGSGVRMNVYSQSYAQVVERWGATGAEAIWQACDVKVLYSGGSEDTLCRKAEDACGRIRIRSGDPRHVAAEHEPVMPYAALRALPPGRALLLRGGAPPVIVRPERYWARGDVRRFIRRGGQPALPLAAPVPAVTPIPALLTYAAEAAGGQELLPAAGPGTGWRAG